MTAEIITLPVIRIERYGEDATTEAVDPVLELAREYFLEEHCAPNIAEEFLAFMLAHGFKMTPVMVET